MAKGNIERRKDG